VLPAISRTLSRNRRLAGPPRRAERERGILTFATDAMMAARKISAASTRSMLTVPPTGVRNRTSRPAATAPSDAPVAITPNNRRACRTSNTEFTNVHACTGAMTAKQFTQT
jgi:hypothetical protein